MAVHSKRVVNGVGRLEYAVSAADLLNTEHPLHKSFQEWLGTKAATKRQAREFLKLYPSYREVKHVE